MVNGSENKLHDFKALLLLILSSSCLQNVSRITTDFISPTLNLSHGASKYRRIFFPTVAFILSSRSI